MADDHPPPAPPKDDKDWTWVLAQPCPECAFDASAVAASEVADRLRSATAAWVDILAEGDDELRRRPEPEAWSALEYACHIRDLLDVYHERLQLMLTVDGASYANWDQDATALENRYDLADPDEVLRDLKAGGDRLATLFDTVENWARTGYRSDGAEFTIDTFSRYLLHDVVHHLWDVR